MPGQRSSRRRAWWRGADAVVLLWCGGWIAAAVTVGMDLQSITKLSGILALAGKSLSSAAAAVGALTHLPLVGHQFTSIRSALAATGATAQTNAPKVGHSVDQLSVLLPVVIAAVPVLSVLAVYVPLRVQRSREGAALTRALSELDPAAMRLLLARRAVDNLAFHQLEAVSDDPWADLAAGRLDRLAAGELRRLGLSPSLLERRGQR